MIHIRGANLALVLSVIIYALLQTLDAQTFELKDFVKAIEKHSIELNDNKSQFESAILEGKSKLSWEFPYVEIEGGVAKEGNIRGAEVRAVLFVKPKLWWVNPLLKDSLQSKSMQYAKSNELILNLNFIEAKRIYLNYIATKEKYKYFLKREENFLKLLSIAKKRLEGGSISQKDFVSFESAYIDSKLASIAVRNDLIELQKTLFTFMGLKNSDYSYSSKDIDSTVYNIERELYDMDKKMESYDDDIVINGLAFEYISASEDSIKKRVDDSLYTEILDLTAKEYAALSKYEGRNLWDSLEIGAGVNYSLFTYSPALQASVPLPFTRKQSHLKAKYLALQSGALNKAEITKKQIAIKAKAYLQELQIQRRYINIATKNIEVKQNLAELNKLGYDAQQVTLFEYITQENAFVDSQIQLVDSQMKYIDLVALLEQTLGESFTKIR